MGRINKREKRLMDILESLSGRLKVNETVGYIIIDLDKSNIAYLQDDKLPMYQHLSAMLLTCLASGNIDHVTQDFPPDALKKLRDSINDLLDTDKGESHSCCQCAHFCEKQYNFGHGCNTLGKQSPDGRLKEWEYARVIGRGVIDALKAIGLDARPVITEDYDVKLNSTEYKEYNKTLGFVPWTGKKAILSRVFRVNDVCYKNPQKKVVLISVHCNASGYDNRWHDARGFSVYVSKKASRNSKRLAEIFFRLAKQNSMLGNRCEPIPVEGSHYWTWDWTNKDICILTETVCPAVLTENFYQDNKGDVEYLLSERGRKEVIDLHVNAILEYLK